VKQFGANRVDVVTTARFIDLTFPYRSYKPLPRYKLAGRAELLQMAYNAVSGAMADGYERSRGIIPARLGNV